MDMPKTHLLLTNEQRADMLIILKKSVFNKIELEDLETLEAMGIPVYKLLLLETLNDETLVKSVLKFLDIEIPESFNIKEEK